MTAPETLAQVFSEIQVLLEGKTIDVEVNANAASYPPPYIERWPDPAYDGLRRVVARVWEQALDGELEGALGKAFTATIDLLGREWTTKDFLTSSMLEELIIQARGDTRLPAAQAVRDWLKEAT